MPHPQSFLIGIVRGNHPLHLLYPHQRSAVLNAPGSPSVGVKSDWVNVPEWVGLLPSFHVGHASLVFTAVIRLASLIASHGGGGG